LQALFKHGQGVGVNLAQLTTRDLLHVGFALDRQAEQLRRAKEPPMQHHIFTDPADVLDYTRAAMQADDTTDYACMFAREVYMEHAWRLDGVTIRPADCVRIELGGYHIREELECAFGEKLT
jgi:hypothetical protein